jgi:hypothetical protein
MSTGRAGAPLPFSFGFVRCEPAGQMKNQWDRSIDNLVCVIALLVDIPRQDLTVKHLLSIVMDGQDK